VHGCKESQAYAPSDAEIARHDFLSLFDERHGGFSILKLQNPSADAQACSGALRASKRMRPHRPFCDAAGKIFEQKATEIEVRQRELKRWGFRLVLIVDC
jgi:hypothetical protein